MSNAQKKIAECLRNAYVTGPVPPLRDGLEPTDGLGAYAVQLINTQYWHRPRVAGSWAARSDMESYGAT